MKAKKRRLIRVPDRVRAVRAAYADALKQGYSIPEAARIAEGLHPTEARPLNEEKASQPKVKGEVSTVRVHGSPDGSPSPEQQPPSQAELIERIPPNWQDLPWPKLKELVTDLTGTAPKSRADANEKIEGLLGNKASSA